MPSRPRNSIFQIFSPRKKNILLPSGAYIIRVSGAPSPKGQPRARVNTRTNESLGCSLNPTQDKQKHSPGPYSAMSPRCSLTSRAENGIRVITRKKPPPPPGPPKKKPPGGREKQPPFSPLQAGR